MSIELLEPSFADVLAAIEASGLPVATKRHWACSLRRIAKALDRPLENLPGRWTAVRIPIAQLHHVQNGNREKTLQNHKANVRKALLWIADEQGVPARGALLSGEWDRLIGEIGEKHIKARLYGLVRYCSAKGIAPADIKETVLDGYMAYRGATTRLAVNAAARRGIARAWNKCVVTVPEWPAQRLVEPPIKSAEGLRLEDLPQELRQVMEDYLAGFTKLRRGANGKRIRPCKASTIRTRKAELMAVINTASGMVPIERIRSLRDLVHPDLVEKVLDAYWRRNGERPKTFTIDLAWKLLSIARDIGLGAEELQRLDDMRAKLEGYRRKGLTSRTRIWSVRCSAARSGDGS